MDHFVPGAVGLARRQRTNVAHDPLRVDTHAELLRKPEVVLHERVLRVVPAADHAGAAVRATASRRPLAVEVRIGDFDPFLPRLAEEGPDRRRHKRLFALHVARNVA